MNHESRITNHEPRTTNHEPRTTNHEPRMQRPGSSARIGITSQRVLSLRMHDHVNSRCTDAFLASSRITRGDNCQLALSNDEGRVRGTRCIRNCDLHSKPNQIRSPPTLDLSKTLLSSHPSVGSVVPPKLKVEATARVTCGEWLERTNPHRQRQPKVKEDS